MGRVIKPRIDPRVSWPRMQDFQSRFRLPQSVVYINKLYEIEMLYNKFDLIMCSETWLDGRYTDGMIYISGFQAYRFDRCKANPEFIQNRSIPKRGGGVIIYVKCTLSKYIKLYNPGTIISKDYEIISLLLDKPGIKDRHQWWRCEFWGSLSLSMDTLFPKAIQYVIYH